MHRTKIGDILQRRKEIVELSDDANYRQVTIGLHHKGVRLRGVKCGSDIKTKRQYLTRENDFILSRIDARNAAFGTVPSELDGAIITNDFWTFDIDEDKVLLDYFHLFTMTDAFLDACVRASTGTTNRQRIQEDFFLGYEFDLPSPADQRRIVERYQAAARQAERVQIELNQQAEDLSLLRQRVLQDAIEGKLTKHDPSDEPAEALLQRIEEEKQQLYEAGKIRKPKKLPPVAEDGQPFGVPRGWMWTRLGILAHSTEAGWSPRCHPRPSDSGEWGVLKVSAVSWGEFDPLENKALPGELDPQPDKVVRSGDFLMSRANTEELVARSVVVRTEANMLMMSDKIVRINFLSGIEAEYANIVNSSELSRTYYAAEASGTSGSMKNVSRSVIKNLPFPLPPLAEQRRIVKKVHMLLTQCNRIEVKIAAAQDDAQRLMRALLEEVLSPSATIEMAPVAA